MALLHEALEARHTFQAQQQEAQESARRNAEAAEKAKKEWVETVKQGKELGSSVVKLLEDHGVRVPQNIMGTQSRADRIFTAAGTWFLIPTAWRMGMTNLQFIDKTQLTTYLTPESKQLPVRVSLVGETAVPAKSPKLEVFVEGLRDHFMLDSDTGGIPQIAPNIYGEKPVRNATLDDVAKYREVVGMVQQRYQQVSQPSR